MAASEARPALTLALLALAFGCAGDPKPEPLPPQAVTQHRREAAEPVPTPAPAAAPAKPETVVVIEPPADSGDRPPTLAEAAQRERERRLTEGVKRPVAVITNQNLAEYAKGQKLTVAEPAGDPGPVAGEGAAAAGDDAEREAYWRERGLDIRERWRDSVDAVARLEEESAALRQRFYATDDPYVRDGQIKPEWDRVLAELDRARRAAAAAPGELADFYEEARHAGALPGWLEEGVELEPEPPSAEGPRRVPEADIGEPPVVEEDPGNP